MYNKCQNKNCNRLFKYYPNTSYFIVNNKVLKVCDKCNLLELNLRLKHLYKGPKQKISKNFEEMIKIIDNQTKIIRSLTILIKNDR